VLPVFVYGTAQSRTILQPVNLSGFCILHYTHYTKFILHCTELSIQHSDVVFLLISTMSLHLIYRTHITQIDCGVISSYSIIFFALGSKDREG